ncbi:MAG: fatty acid desaturase [Planctomycetota bacterium]
MSTKHSRRDSRRHYRKATEPSVQPSNEKDVSDLLNASPTEASGSKWASGRPHVARSNNINWVALGWLIMIHIAAASAIFMPWTFSWSGLVLVFALHWLCGGIGICLGYHRMLTHSSFKTHPWVRRMIATIGCLAGEGPPCLWVANHRLHHARSDQDGDPHSPHEGSIWSHAFWLAFKVGGTDGTEYIKRWAPDLYRDRYIRYLDYGFVPVNLALSALLFGLGYAWGGSELAVSWLVWGVGVRMVFVLHSTWLVNSASHMWGYRNYETRDDSRNNWWVALITYGEGWHNNHHAHPKMANHGHKWWEFDMTFNTIRLMRFLGLAWDVIDYRNAAERREKQKAA